MSYMASNKIGKIGTLGTIFAGIGAIALITNPGEAGYRQYADEKIKTELKNKVCEQVAEDLGVWLKGQCHILISTASPYLADTISQQTQRQNFYLFSIYQVDLFLPAPLPKYHVATIGLFGNYHTYQAKKL
ncbi:hypothetical protein C7B62_17190 [Pleurocapsa sp. CCALA 161]|nr:hypothetical protein C7B62_17190 [Pleurocapsa sp. CCALA 161]